MWHQVPTLSSPLQYTVCMHVCMCVCMLWYAADLYYQSEITGVDTLCVNDLIQYSPTMK